MWLFFIAGVVMIVVFLESYHRRPLFPSLSLVVSATSMLLLPLFPYPPRPSRLPPPATGHQRSGPAPSNHGR